MMTAAKATAAAFPAERPAAFRAESPVISPAERPAASPAPGTAYAGWFAPALTLVYAGALLFLMLHHEMWRDETHAWMIARHSESFLDVWKFGAYEGTPMLWSTLLRPLTWISASPLLMQAVHFAIATATVFVVSKYAPFTRLQKILFPFGYFPLFEYGVISRNYALGFLLVMLLCVYLPNRHRRPLRIGVVLLLLSQTSAHALMIAGGVTAGLMLEYWMRRRSKDAAAARGSLAAPALAALGAAAAVLQMWPSADVDFAGPETYRLAFDWAHLAGTLTAIGKGLFPATEWRLHFWYTLLFVLPWGAALSIALGIAVFHRRYPIALLMCLCAGAGLLALLYVVHGGEARHHGFFFILLLFLLWARTSFARDAAAAPPKNRRRAEWERWQKRFGAALFTALLLFHAFAGARAALLEYRHTFSAAQHAAQFIRDANLADLPVIGHIDVTAEAVLAHLHEKDAMHYLAADHHGNVLRFSKSRSRVADLHTKAVELARDGGKVLLVMSRPISPSLAQHGYRLLASFPESVALRGDESAYIYLFEPPKSPGAD
ncbi:MAG: hypothetical protein OD817_05880 [Gammaproteobacteria bacterium]